MWIDFEQAYGQLGAKFIAAHHTKPVSELAEGESESISDLIPVCSNCHRMLHRQYPALDWRKLKEIVTTTYVKRQEN